MTRLSKINAQRLENFRLLFIFISKTSLPFLSHIHEFQMCRRDCLIMHWSCTFRLGLFLNHHDNSGVKYAHTQQQDKTGISHLSLRV
jgi:hypothetical protein